MNTQDPAQNTIEAPCWRPSICPLGEDNLHEIIEYRYRMMEESGVACVLDQNWRELCLAYYAGEYTLGRCLHHGAFVDGRLVGIAGALVRTNFPYNTFRHKAGGWVMDVYVEPAFRGRGLARRLSQAAVDWLKSKELNDIRLMASAQAKELRLYEPLGFVYTNEMRLA